MKKESDAKERLELLEAINEISNLLVYCKDEFEKTDQDQPANRKKTVRVIEEKEERMKKLAHKFGKKIPKDVNHFLKRARNLAKRSVEEWSGEWKDMVADTDKIEKDFHHKKSYNPLARRSLWD